MGSINGLKTISATSIQNAGQFYLGNNLDSGTPGQVIISAGSQEAALWGSNAATLPGALTMGTNLSLASGNASFDGAVADTINASGLTITGGNGISVVGGTEILTDNDNTTINNSGGTGQQNQVLKVPNALTSGTGIGFSAGTTYDGSAAITINSTATDTTYQGSSTIDIDTSTTPDTINALKVPNTLIKGTNITFSSGTTYDGSAAITIGATDTNTTYTVADPITLSAGNEIGLEIDGNTIFLDGAELAVAKVPNTLTFTGTDTGTFDGSSALSINLTDTDTTYQGGTNISIDTSTTPDSINLDVSIMNQTLLLFNQTGITTAIIGSAYPNKPTTVTYLDLRSATNTIPGGVLATKIQQTYMRRDIGTTYIEYSSNFRTSFVAQSASVMVEFYAVIAAYSSKLFYGGLYDYINSQFFATSQTQHRFKFDNGLDQDPTSCMWYLTGLTAGTTYYISPYFKSSKATSYIYAGNSGTAGSFAPGILRIVDGGNNVGIY